VIIYTHMFLKGFFLFLKEELSIVILNWITTFFFLHLMIIQYRVIYFGLSRTREEINDDYIYIYGFSNILLLK